MATVTLEVEEEVLERARREASRRGTSVESFATSQLKELAGTGVDTIEKARVELDTLTAKHPLFSPEGRIPNRDERNERYDAEEREKLLFLRDAAQEGIDAIEAGSCVTLTSAAAITEHLHGLRARQ